MSTPNEWWGGLPEPAKDTLAADPRGPISGELWQQVTGAASPDDSWTTLPPGPEGHRLPEELAAFVERRTVRLVAD